MRHWSIQTCHAAYQGKKYRMCSFIRTYMREGKCMGEHIQAHWLLLFPHRGSGWYSCILLLAAYSAISKYIDTFSLFASLLTQFLKHFHNIERPCSISYGVFNNKCTIVHRPFHFVRRKVASSGSKRNQAEIIFYCITWLVHLRSALRVVVNVAAAACDGTERHILQTAVPLLLLIYHIIGLLFRHFCVTVWEHTSVVYWSGRRLMLAVDCSLFAICCTT